MPDTKVERHVPYTKAADDVARFNDESDRWITTLVSELTAAVACLEEHGHVGDGLSLSERVKLLCVAYDKACAMLAAAKA